MTPGKDTPVFNLKAVVRETGLKPDTLRAWERRYGIPTPQRASSGHRLYSENDIEMLHWLVARQEEGLSISRAVELWQRLSEAGELPTAPAGRAGQPTYLAPGGGPHTPAGGNAGGLPAGVVAEMLERWVDACLQFDEQGAEQVLSQAFALFSPETVCFDIIQAGLARIGEGWYLGRVTVQQEHFASALALRRLESMLAATPPPTRPGRLLVGLPPEEQHTFVPLMITLLLRRRGWDTIYLGANVPVESFAETLEKTRPTLVILTAQQLHTAASLAEMGEVLLQQRVPLAFGGLVFTRVPAVVKAIPGHYLGPRLDGMVPNLEQLMTNLRLQPALRTPSAEYRTALGHFRAEQAAVEAEVWRHFQRSPLAPRMLAAANAHFSSNIAAALTLGDLDFLSADIDWVEGLLTYHAGLPADSVDAYLEAYLDACRTVMDPRGAPLVRWLAQLVGNQSLIDEQIALQRQQR
jgi:DNA-binding transcriptional MerR regulator